MELYTLTGVHPKKKVLFPLVIINMTVVTIITTLVLVNCILHPNLETIESIGILSQSYINYSVAVFYRNRINSALRNVEYFWEINLEDSRNKDLSTYFNSQKLYLYFLGSSLVAFYIKPLILTDETILNCYIPDGVPFIVIYLLEVHFFLIALPIYAGLTMLMCIFILSTVGQMRMLNEKIKKLNLDQIENNNDLIICTNKLKKYVAYHNFLLTHIKGLNNIVSLPMTLLLGSNIALLCTSMLNLASDASPMVKSRSAMSAIAVTLQYLFLYGIPAQFLMDEVEAMGTTLYSDLSWYLPNIIPVRKYILMMMIRCQTPQCISAEGFIDINNRTFLFVAKTAYSFFTFFQTMS